MARHFTEKRFFSLIAGLLICVAAMAQEAVSGTWKGTLTVNGTSLDIVFNIDEGKPTIDSPAQGAYGIPMIIGNNSPERVVLDIPTIYARFEGRLDNGEIEGTFSQSGMKFPMTLKPGKAGKAARPQTPDGKGDYTEKEITFANGEATLSGTLTIPSGADRSTPAVVMVTGSGQQNRDEEMFGHKPFAVIADYLADNGIASLRYDDRGYGKSTGRTDNITIDDIKEDAAAAVNELRKHFDSVGIVGHSEGGTIAFMLGKEKKADFIVSLAGMTVSGKETMVMQNRYLFEKNGMDKELADKLCNIIERMFTLLGSGIDKATLQSEIGKAIDRNCPEIAQSLRDNIMKSIETLNTPYMRSFINISVGSKADAMECPAMVLNGSKDIQVDAERNIGAVQGKLKNRKSTTRIYPGMNHLFQHATTGDITEYGQIEETMAPEVLRDIASWIKSLK